MKELLRKIFSLILNIFETGNEPYAYKPRYKLLYKLLYKPMNRTILIVIGVLFLGLMSAVAYLSFDKGEPGFLIPVVVFSAISLVTLVVGSLGSERAVAKIWGNR